MLRTTHRRRRVIRRAATHRCSVAGGLPGAGARELRKRLLQRALVRQHVEHAAAREGGADDLLVERRRHVDAAVGDPVVIRRWRGQTLGALFLRHAGRGRVDRDRGVVVDPQHAAGIDGRTVAADEAARRGGAVAAGDLAQGEARDAGVTKLTVYNHFQDKATLFTCAIEDTCEALIMARPPQLSADSNFQQALAQHRGPVSILRAEQFSRACGRAQMLALLDRGALPDALITTAYVLLEGVFDALRERDLLWPEQLRLGTFGDAQLLDFLPIRVNAISQQHAQIAEQVLEQAIRAIEQGDYRPGVIAIERELKVRRG